MMKEFLHIVAFCCWVALLAGCDAKPLSLRDEGKPRKVYLNIAIALSDVSRTGTRVDDAAPLNDNERMQTLRIVVVRPDGTVEENRFIALYEAVERYGTETFEVVGSETKRIYLFVNERAEIVSGDAAAVLRRRALAYDLSSIVAGGRFPAAELAALTIGLKPSERFAGLLPMCESHEVAVGDTDYECSLFVTRAAVKFTFRITNRGQRAVNLTGLAIEKSAFEEFYLPHNAFYEDRVSPGGTRYKEIVSYDVPSTEAVDYYTYGAESGLAVELPVGQTVELDPIYQLEGKYRDPQGDARNYALRMWIDGAQLDSYFPALAQLPRNTHVVVNVAVNDTRIDWEVDLLPYTEKYLDPSFGL